WYCLTGVVTEHKFVFPWGQGRNGKGKMGETFFNIMGDYATKLSSETLMQRDFQPHREELMGLKGARFVLSGEVAENARWNQARLMELTGGDPIKANYMRENSVVFPMEGKLYIAGNNQPEFESHNNAA